MYNKAEEFLKNKVIETNEKYYEIVEDTYEYENGLTLITYYDENHEHEKDFVCVNVENFK